MLLVEERSRIAVVLVGARNPQNIGAAARAMQDFGFRDLRVVNEYEPPFEAAQLEAKSAVAAGDVMREARLFSSLQEAIGDRTIVIGTTAIGGRELARPVLALKEAVEEVLAAMAVIRNSPGDGVKVDANTRVAILFGSEKTGLTREQLSYCSLLATIPMYAPEGRHLSMNLGQAVAVCLYELVRSGFEGSRDLPDYDLVAPDTALRERVFDLALEVMRLSGYARRFPAHVRPEVVRQLTSQLGRTREEAATWIGFFRQLLRRLEVDRA